MGRPLFLLFLIAALGCAPGCFGVSHNPSYFPYYHPFGDVIKTHAKPPGAGYYANFDPHAIDLEVEPIISTSQVGTQVVLLTTVKDEKGTPRRNRRVDWLVTGGNLVEVDESGHWPGRGGIEANRAFSYTNYGEHRLTRGNTDPKDDIMLRPGQSWCVVSSPVEGDTHVQVVVPGIHNWEKRMKTALIRWVDAAWEFPPRAVAKFGTEHEFTTKLTRHTDRLPLANYRVRYKIVDGPAAILLPTRTQEDTVITDLRGFAKVRIAQLSPASGVNRVSVEIIRPPDPTAPSGTGVPIVTGETSVEWLAPDVKLSHTGPASAALNTDVVFTTTATNNGRMQSGVVEITLPIPEELEFVGSQPPNQPRMGKLVFDFPELGVGQSHTVQTSFKCKRPGSVRSVALLRTEEGQTDQKELNLVVTQPQLKVDIIAPKTGLIDVPINYAIRLSNPGTGDLDAVTLQAEFDKGLEHDKTDKLNARGKYDVTMKASGLKAGEVRDENLVLTPRQAGPLGLMIKASGGGLEQTAMHLVTVQKPNMTLRVEGTKKNFVGRPAEWKIYVKNDSDAEQTGVVVRDRLPAELRFVLANRGGNHVGGEVTWNLGTLKPNEEAVLELTAESQRATTGVDKITQLSADGNIRLERTSRIEIEGRAALNMKLTSLNNPVEVGKSVGYRVVITNTGSAPANLITLKATVPDLLKAVQAKGPTRETIVGASVAFDKVDNLQPGASVTYLIECQALKDGDARFRVEYTSELNATPIIEEEATRIISPFLAPLGPAPPPAPPAPPGGVPPVPKPLPPG